MVVSFPFILSLPVIVCVYFFAYLRVMFVAFKVNLWACCYCCLQMTLCLPCCFHRGPKVCALYLSDWSPPLIERSLPQDFQKTYAYAYTYVVLKFISYILFPKCQVRSRSYEYCRSSDVPALNICFPTNLDPVRECLLETSTHYVAVQLEVSQG